MMAAAGVFILLVTVGLVPRFAGKTHTSNKIMLYENMVILGAISGSFLTIFERYCHVGAFLQERMPGAINIITGAGNVLLAVFGVFAGMFVGSLALAIAEMLDAIPIFARRVSFRHGIGLAVLAMAAGKLCGSLLYFFWELYHVLKS